MKRPDGTGSVYPARIAICGHCTARSRDHSQHSGGWKAKLMVRGTAVRRNAKSRGDALKALDRLKIEHGLGRLVPGRGRTLDEYATSWINRRDPELPMGGQRKLEYTTIRALRYRMKPILAAIGHVRLSALEPRHIEKALGAAAARGLRDISILECHKTLIRLLNAAARERPPLVTTNVARAVERLRVELPEIYFLDKDHTMRFLEAGKDHYLHAAFVVAIFQGPRAGEIWGLRWKAIDWAHRSMSISESLYWKTASPSTVGTWALKTPKSRNSRRTVRLAARTAAALRAHFESETKRLGREPRRDEFVWTDAGAPIRHAAMLQTAFYPLCKAASIPTVKDHACAGTPRHNGCPPFFHFHGLRHTYATLALERTKDLFTVSRTLGHSSTKITSDVYGHVLDSQRDAIADAMDSMEQEGPALGPTPADPSDAPRTDGDANSPNPPTS